MRTAYKKIQKGMKTRDNLAQDRIERLEEIGFQWQVLRTDHDEAFEPVNYGSLKHFELLVALL